MFGSRPPGNLFPGFSMHKIGVFYKAPIEVDNIESAVRASGKIYGMEPRISRSQEFLLVFAAPRHERNSVRFQHPSMDQVQQRLAHKGVPTIFFAESVAAIYCQSGQSIEILYRLVVEGEWWRGEWKHAACVSGFHDFLQ